VSKKVALVILDGWGLGKSDASNGIYLAKTPFIDSLYEKYPNSKLITFGEDVGLPEGQMGNSEVGHMNIGAGRVVYQDLVKINKEIKEKHFFENKVLLDAIEYANKNQKKVHLLGLVSNGGVHSSQEHLYALCSLFHEKMTHSNLVFIHAFTDGRDCAPDSGLGFVKTLEEKIKNTSIKIASVIGRYYAMDRDNRWERIKKAYDLMVNGVGKSFTVASEAIQESYKNGITDEFVEAYFNTAANGKIEKDDVVICFNFRTDRCREITQALHQENFHEFNMSKLDLYYITMTNYNKNFKNVKVIYGKDELTNTLGEVISKNGKTQLRIAETEKYPHVSFFFSGGREQVFEGESRIMVNSPKVATYDLQPEMSAYEVTENVLSQMQHHQPDFICLNYANGDMVGHTGVPKAIIKACETVDSCVAKIVEKGLENDYSFIIIADHGNADLMINEDGSPHTAHTLNLVPCILIDKDNSTIQNGRLADIAPTVLSLMEISKPLEMDGNSLV
jgi:2,3-bisphosphoglycerate-independent phosphoglycerate mutase